MKNKIILIIVLLGVLCACYAPEKKFQEYSINPFLESRALQAKKSGSKVKLQLCNETAFNWDKLIIVPPYSTPRMIRGYKLANSTFVERHLLGRLYLESDCLLLFIEKNAIVKYAYAARVPIDFNYINGSDNTKLLPRKMACELYVQYANNNYKLITP